MSLEAWIDELAKEFVRSSLFFDLADARRHISENRDDWLRQFRDGLSPADAASEQIHVASLMGT